MRCHQMSGSWRLEAFSAFETLWNLSSSDTTSHLRSIPSNVFNFIIWEYMITNQKSKNQHMHYILTSKSIAPTYVSTSTSHLQTVKVLHTLDIHWFIHKHLIHQHGTLNLHWIIHIQKQDCHQFITNIYVILRKLLTFYTYNMKEKRNSFPGFYMFGRLMLVVSWSIGN
jgi:hypothetical protein